MEAVPNATYTITDNPNDDQTLNIQNVKVMPFRTLHLRFNRIPVNVYDLQINTRREINGHPDNNYYQGSVRLDLDTFALMI